MEEYLNIDTKIISGGNIGAGNVRGLNFLYFLIFYLIREFKNLSPSPPRFTDILIEIIAVKLVAC